MITFNQALKQATLKARDDFDALVFKRYLVELCADESIDLYLRMFEEMPDALIKTYNEGIEDLLKDKPLAHVLGYEWFYGRKFKVNQDVLIPRPETEELVVHVMDRVETLFNHTNLNIADVACGSGIIGCTLKAEMPECSVTCTDISAPALMIAQENATSLGLEISFKQGNMLEPIQNEAWDVIVCNPPYIEQDEALENSVKDYEPHLALFGGHDGLDLYRLFLDQLQTMNLKKTLIAFEMGHQQRHSITQEIVKRFPKVSVECELDLNGKERMLFFVIEKP